MFYGWYIVAACCMISFYAAGSMFFGFTAVIDPIATEFGWSYAQISFASSLRGLESGLFIPIAGLMMNRWGPRRLIFSGSLITGLGMVLLSQVNSLLSFYMATIIIATGLSAMPNVLLMTVVANWFRKKMGLATGIAASGVAFGGLMIPLITLIIDKYGWRQAMIFTGIGMWMIPLPLSLVLRHKPEQYGYRPDGEISPPASDDNASYSTRDNEIAVSLKEALKSQTFWVISVAYLIIVIPISAVGAHIMPYLGSIGMDRATASIIASAAPLLTIVGRIGCGWLGDKVDKKMVVIVSFSMAAFGMLMLPLISAENTWLIAVYVFFFGIGWGGSVPMISGLCKDHFGLENLSTIVGFVGGMIMAGMFIGAPLAGWVYDKWGRYEPVWYALSGLVVLTTVLFKFLLKKSPVAS